MDLKKNQLSSEDNGGETNIDGMQQVLVDAELQYMKAG